MIPRPLLKFVPQYKNNTTSALKNKGGGGIIFQGYLFVWNIMYT